MDEFIDIHNEREQMVRELRKPHEEVDRLNGYDEIVGTSPAMKQVYEQIELIKDDEISVLIVGETGTGKSLSREQCIG